MWIRHACPTQSRAECAFALSNPTLRGLCTHCPSNAITVLIVVAGVCGGVIVLLLITRYEFDALKPLLLHLQRLALILSFDVAWPSTFAKLRQLLASVMLDLSVLSCVESCLALAQNEPSENTCWGSA